MAYLSKRTKKYLRYTLTGILLTGMVLVTGFLSFAGSLVISDSIYLALTAFFLAGVIEGEIYAQNISGSLLKLFSGEYMEEALLKKLLSKLIKENLKNKTDEESFPFLTDYKRLLDKEKALLATHGNENKETLEEVQRSLKWQRRYFNNFIMNRENSPLAAKLNNPTSELEKLVPEKGKTHFQDYLRSKINQNRLGWILNIGGGLSCGLVSLAVAKTSLLTLATHFGFAISGIALSANIFGLAFISALGYSLLIHHSLSSMIQNATLQKWWRDGKNYFKSPAPIVWKVLAFLGLGLVAGLGIFATIATAGTWWYAAKTGAEIILKIPAFVSAVIATIGVILMGSSMLNFNVTSSFKTTLSAKSAIERSINRIKKFFNKTPEQSKTETETKIKKPTTATESKWARLKFKIHQFFHKEHEHSKMEAATENRLQHYNPLRFIIKLISLPLKISLFIGHLVSMGLMSDKLEGANAEATALACGLSEGAQDGDFIFKSHHNHTEEEQAKKSDATMATTATTETNLVTTTDKEFYNLDHYDDGEDENDHVHLDLIGFALKIALFPLYLLSATWDCIASQFNKEPLETLNPWKALKKAYTHDHHHHEAPPLDKIEKVSGNWQMIERGLRLNKALKKHGNALPPEAKIELVDGLSYNITIDKPAFFQKHKLTTKAQSNCEHLIEKFKMSASAA